MKKIKVILTGAVVCLNLVTVAFADTGTSTAATQDVKAEIEALKARISQLEAKLAATPAVPASPAPSATPTLEIPSMVKGIQLSGFVDAAYNYNFNQISLPTATNSNATRVFDNNANTLNLDAAKITLQKTPTSDDRVGFRTDILAGHDAELIHSAGLGLASTDVPFDLEQAFVELSLPTKNVIHGANDMDLKVGKFVTMHGAEVIESKDNWNISRSLLFGWAIPFTHTGVRAGYTFDNGWDLYLGVNNGWDTVIDTNKGKSVEGHFGFNGLKLPGDSSLTIALNGMFGPETTSSTKNRYLSDIVVTYKTPWKPLTLMYNYDYASEERVLPDPSNALDIGVDTADWQGHAAYARIDINDQWSVSGRYEWFQDDNHVRIAPSLPGTIAPGDTYWETTGTLEYRPWKNIVTRLEYRHDAANQPVFFDRSVTGFSDTQDTISGEVIFIF